MNTISDTAVVWSRQWGRETPNGGCCPAVSAVWKMMLGTVEGVEGALCRCHGTLR